MIQWLGAVRDALRVRGLERTLHEWRGEPPRA
jgi:hypothetical protein